MSLSPNLKQAVEYLQSHAHGMRAVLDVADAVTDVSSLEQAAQEAVNARDAAQADHAKIEKKIEAAKHRLKDAEDQNVADRTAAQAALAEAQSSARTIIATAEHTAANIITEANGKAEQLIADADKRRQGVISGMDVEIAARKADAATLDAAIEVKRGEVADLEGRMERARKYLARLAEGD